jgi:putative ABC transport system permease protein
MTMFFYHMRHALQRLIREPAFTVATVLTLALGVGANVAVFAVVEAVLLRPLPYADAGRLVIVNHRDMRTGLTKPFIAIGDYVDFVERQKSFESVVGYDMGQLTVYGVGDPFQASVMVTAPGLFDMMRLRPFLGRALGADDSRDGAAPAVMLGYELWRDRFDSDPDIVGRGVQVGQRLRTVVGVAPAGFEFPPGAGGDLILPMQVPVQAPAGRKSEWTFAVARLRPGQTTQSATADLAAISNRLEQEYPASNQGSTYYAEPLRDALVGSTKNALILMLAAVGFVLLIACANVANLQLARSLGRRREMAVRLALGSGRGRLAALLLSENGVLALMASLAGLAFAHWGVRALVALIPDSVTVPGLADIRLNGLVLTFAFGLGLLTALAFGFIAAFTVRLETAADVLVSAGRATMTRLARRATSGLVVVEIALAVVLLIGAGLILRSFAGLLAVDPGFHYDRVMTVAMQLPADPYQDVEASQSFWQRAFDDVRAMPGVIDAGAAVVVPLTGNNWTVGFERADQPLPAGERPPDVGWQVASGGYFRALQIPLLEGRLFDDRDHPGGAPVVIISESIRKRFFKGEDAVGRMMKTGDGQAEIVGVVGDIRRAGLTDEPNADLYFPFESNPRGQVTLFVRTTADPAAAAGPLRTALKSIEPNTVFVTERTLGDIASQSLNVTKLVLWLLSVFALLALVLAAIGIYGVMSYVVRQRTREIGTRMAVGATRGSIARLVMKQGTVIAVAGIAAGLLIGLAAARSLGAVLYGVSPADPLTLFASTLVLAMTTLIACYIPARRASAVDPARTLAQP